METGSVSAFFNISGKTAPGFCFGMTLDTGTVELFFLLGVGAGDAVALGPGVTDKGMGVGVASRAECTATVGVGSGIDGDATSVCETKN